MSFEVDVRRVHKLRDGQERSGPVVYWMSRDQRVDDNWALLYSQLQAHKRQQPMAVVFCLCKEFLGATWRQYSFMLHGLREIDQRLSSLGIPLFVLIGDPPVVLSRFVRQNNISLVVTDFSPLRIIRRWKKSFIDATDISIIEVDAHNIVPCRVASQKREYAARTFRPKVSRCLDEFLTDYPELEHQTVAWTGDVPEIDWSRCWDSLTVDKSVGDIYWLKPGEEAAMNQLDSFIRNSLEDYTRHRNDPARIGQSDLSPYLHFGQISAQKVALEVQSHCDNSESRDAFLEELIVRRELSDNFCFYEHDYDKFEAFPDWARSTLEGHRNDPRNYIYSDDELENSETHDELWNAAQREMVVRGKMHGYMRMYWAKKILEWTVSPEEAFRIAIYSNDKYELDGRDPNGYAGIAWSIGGVHDRAWSERAIFGKIRYMSYDGCRRKFDIRRYIERVNSL
jgi:deoxyribodipyrimidine photo-lyase